MSKVPWKLVLPFVGMLATYFGALYLEFDPCSALWPDRCAPLVAEKPPVAAPIDKFEPDAGAE